MPGSGVRLGGTRCPCRTPARASISSWVTVARTLTVTHIFAAYTELSALLKQYIKIPKDEQMDDRVKEIYDISIIPNKIWFPENLTRAIEILNDKTQAVDADE